MRIACIIMAHKGPPQIERFLKKFSGLPFDFYIHVDKKIDKSSFEYLAPFTTGLFYYKKNKGSLGFLQLYCCYP